MARGVDNPQLRERLGVPSFEQRWPWIGGDLQTLRDTLREVDLPHDQGVSIEIPVPALPSGAAAAGSLLALLDQYLVARSGHRCPPIHSPRQRATGVGL